MDFLRIELQNIYIHNKVEVVMGDEHLLAEDCCCNTVSSFISLPYTIYRTAQLFCPLGFPTLTHS